MNKLFTKIAALALGAAMVVGVGVSVGSKSKVSVAEASDVSISFPGSPSAYTGSYTSSFTMTVSSQTYTFTGFNNGSKAADNWTAIRGARKNTAWTGSIATPQIASKVKYLSINVTQKPSVTTTTSMTVATDSAFSSVVETVNVSLTATGELRYNVTTPAVNYYYRLNFSVGSDNGSNGTLRIDSFDITYDAGTPDVDVTGVELNKESTSVSLGSTETLTATVSPSDATDKSVSWSSSVESVATVAAGVVTPVDVGSTVITVTTTDGSFTDTCTVTVPVPSYTTKTVAEAITIMDGQTAGVDSTDYYQINGYIIGITTPYDSGYGNISFTVGDTADATTTITCFRVKCSSEVAATVLAGAQVSIMGKLQRYVKNSNTTYELTNSLPSQLSITGGTEPQTYTVTFAEALTVLAGLTSGTPTYDFYTVQGYVKSIDTAHDGTKMTFSFAASSAGTDLIKVYNIHLSSTDAAKVEVGATVQVTGNLELYNTTNELVNGKDFELISAPVVTQYTVTYANGGATGGSVPTDSNSPYNSGATVTVLGNTGSLEKTGFTFAGWSDGTTTYTAGDTFTISGNTTLTAQWTENVTPSAGAVNYYQLSSSDTITSGRYIIAVNTGSVYAMTRTLSSGRYAFSSSAVTVTSGCIASADGSDYEFEFEVDTNGIAIKNLSTGKYIKGGTSSSFNAESSEPYYFTQGSAKHGSFRLILSGATTRGIVARTGSTNGFGPYAVSNASASSTEYYDVELFRGYTAEDYATEFVNNTSCTADGSTAPTFTSGYSWSKFNDNFDDKLTSAQQNILKSAEYTKSGSGSSTVVNPASGVSQTVANCVAKYDYIVGKYNPTLDTSSTWLDFMDRKPEAVSSGSIVLDPLGISEGNPTAIIIIVSVIGVSALGGFFFLRKRKEI